MGWVPPLEGEGKAEQEVGCKEASICPLPAMDLSRRKEGGPRVAMPETAAGSVLIRE